MVGGGSKDPADFEKQLCSYRCPVDYALWHHGRYIHTNV